MTRIATEHISYLAEIRDDSPTTLYAARNIWYLKTVVSLLRFRYFITSVA
jgi:hypothetical protein